ncbi:GNAT family N-acetyltransferase [Streptomyces sp. NBC_00091]|uniref:GNAT family N-acetyltransferase n=1 Tax=Streptomyces sp. NBC_00091 TaxID=2975648 RepID=UPI0022583B66|nr:GNAT family N-acetyltransferase [Streptomyces sp. NBC_00091]MCX5379368.1 GNAT family N-acetyltransferase [Streptomyces sp. NBC_00091]
MTTTFPDVTISTDRLVLRPFEEEDVTALAEMMNDEQVTAWTSVPHPYTHADARAWATALSHTERTEGRGIVFAVTEFLTQRLVGIVHLQNTNWRTRTTEVGYVTAPWARGEGYASESVLAVAQWLLRDQRFERLELRTAADNTASQQVAQKIGCISEGVLRNAWIVRTQGADGSWAETRTDLIVWSLVPEDLDEADEYDAYESRHAYPGHTVHSGYDDGYPLRQRADATGYAVGADRN